MDKGKLIKKLIGDILDISESDEGYVTVAEIRSIEVDGQTKTLDMNTALISPLLTSKIKASHTNPYIRSTGVNYDEEFVYTPSFWIYLSKPNGLKKAEPLVISWESINNTMLIIDQGFVSTFDLCPRFLKDIVYWDDLSRPKYEIVQNKLISNYDYPKYSTAYVRIDKEYLERYLYLRKKSAVQVFTIIGNVHIDADILHLLNEKDYYIEELQQHEIRIKKLEGKENIARFEVNGYRLILERSNEFLKETETPNGHYWKGHEGLVTSWRARHEMLFEYVHVSDEVLSKYEDDNNYEIYPLFGSVKYKSQWAISHSERVGKNGIKIEIKKLYEGLSFEVIDYWNKFSIHPSEIIKGENIVVKAEKLTKAYFKLARLLSQIVNENCGYDFSPSDLISLDEESIEYRGWTDFHDYESITNHVNLGSFSKEQFISRCKKLYILLVENLKEGSLRKVVRCLGFPENISEKYRSLKLLETIIKYSFVSVESGLNLRLNKEDITERVLDLKEFDLMHKLFALNNIRQLDAHKKSKDSDLKLYTSLDSFEIERNSINNNYATTCENVYDSLAKSLRDLNTILTKVTLTYSEMN